MHSEMCRLSLCPTCSGNQTTTTTAASDETLLRSVSSCWKLVLSQTSVSHSGWEGEVSLVTGPFWGLCLVLGPTNGMDIPGTRSISGGGMSGDGYVLRRWTCAGWVCRGDGLVPTRGVVSTGLLACGHLIWHLGHLLLDSTGPEWPPSESLFY